MHVLLTRTALGLFIQSIGINPAASRVAGVRERLIIVCVYVFCGIAAGVAGLVISSNVKSADGNNAGVLMELDAILAVTLGGTALTGGRFSLAGSVLGALIIQTLTSTIYSIGVPPEVNMVVKAAVVFAVMLLQSPEFRSTVRRLVVRPAAESRTMTASAAVPHEARAWCPSTRASCRSLGTVVVFALAAGYGSVAYNGFFSAQVFLNLLIDNAFLCIVGVGMTFVILSGGIDLSVGSLIALTTMISAGLGRACPLERLADDSDGARDRHRVRRADGVADRALPAAAVHRDPGRHVPRARPLLPDQHRLDQHHRRGTTPRSRKRASGSATARRSRSAR